MTQTRAEVEAAVEKLANSHLGMSLVEWNAVSNTILTCAAENQALRERAKAAERERDGAVQWRNHYRQSWLDCRDALTAARRAEAAAWNDAIEAAAAWHQSEIARLKEQVSENNAYLARVGAASYDSDANRYCIDQINAHQQSVAAIRALRRAAPTEGEA